MFQDTHGATTSDGLVLTALIIVLVQLVITASISQQMETCQDTHGATTSDGLVLLKAICLVARLGHAQQNFLEIVYKGGRECSQMEMVGTAGLV